MKRELGENPEQSRCCMLIRSAVQSHLPLPYDEGGKANSKSESEDLQNARELIKALFFRGKRALSVLFYSSQQM